MILVAVDGSESSNNALKQAARFARKRHSNLLAVTVIPPYEGELDLTGVRNIREAMREPGEKILNEAKKIALEEGVELKTILAEGNVHEAIVDTAITNECDLIVIGRRGVRRLATFMGSTTERVIGYSPIDVLVMPRGSTIKWDNIVLAVDGSRFSEMAASRAISLAQAYSGQLSIISVVDIPTESYAEAPDVVDKMIEQARELVDDIAKTARASGVPAEGYVREGASDEKIIELADELDADIICMGSHGRTGLMRLLMGSITEKVIGHAKCPVLVVKSH